MSIDQLSKSVAGTVKIIFLEDHGQTFLALYVSETGWIYASKPESGAYVGWTVTNHKVIKSGDILKLERYSKKTDLIYPCLMVQAYGR